MQTSEFKKFVSATKNRLYRLSLWMLHNPQDAEDIVQEVYVKLWDMKDKLNNYRSPEALAVTMTRNLSLNKVAARKPVISEQLFERFQSTHQSPDVLMESKEDLSFVKSLINSLPEKQKQVLLLRGIEGLDTKEIATLLEETENNVRVTLSRARNNLRNAYQKIFVEYEK